MQPNMSESTLLPYLPANVVAIITSWAARNNIDDWKQLCLVFRDFYYAARNDLYYR